MIDAARTVLSQYQSSPIMSALLTFWNENLDPRGDFLQFYNSVWDITTADTYGLDVWGRIVGVPRSFVSTETFNYFHFHENDSAGGFRAHPFFAGAISGVTPVYIPDTIYRQMILLKALANFTSCSARQLNRLLAALYQDRGACYVIDNLDMSFTYRFKFTLDSTDTAVLEQSGILPRPAGTVFTIVQGA